MHTLLVDDLDAFMVDLTNRGVIAGPIETIGGAVRHTIISDPDGNRLNIAQTSA